MLHDEPIFFKKKIIGYTTSSNYSFCYKKNLCLGYVSGSFDKNQKLYLEVEGKKYPLIIEKTECFILQKVLEIYVLALRLLSKTSILNMIWVTL